MNDKICLSQKKYVSNHRVIFDKMDIELKAPLSGVAILHHDNKVRPYLFALNYTLWIDEFMPNNINYPPICQGK